MITLNSVAIFFVFIDRLLKIYANSQLFGEKITLIRGVFFFELVKNQNIAFSLPLSGVWVNILIFLVLGLILGIIIKNGRKIGINGTFLLYIFLGGLSNLADRIRFGSVIDYFHLNHFTVFNLADMMITFGVFGILLANFKQIYNKEAKN